SVPWRVSAGSSFVFALRGAARVSGIESAAGSAAVAAKAASTMTRPSLDADMTFPRRCEAVMKEVYRSVCRSGIVFAAALATTRSEHLASLVHQDDRGGVVAE